MSELAGRTKKLEIANVRLRPRGAETGLDTAMTESLSSVHPS